MKRQWIGLDGKDTEKKGEYYWGTQLGRIKYTPGQTISSYTEVTRLANLIAANSTGTDVGTLKRVESTVSEDSSVMLVMAVTTDNKVYFTYYDFQQLNALLDQKDSDTSHFLSCKDSTDVQALAHDWGSSLDLKTMLPLSTSIQGLAIDSSQGVYISSGAAKKGAYIAKASWGGSFNQQSVSPSGETGWDASATSQVEIEGLQLYYGDVDAAVTKHLDSGDKSYIYSFPETQF